MGSCVHFGFGSLVIVHVFGIGIIVVAIVRDDGYSAISHMGYALFGILAATESGYSAALYYVLIYAIMSTGAFGLLFWDLPKWANDSLY
ncbi:MAG: proton-conducting transporter membrane subunit [Legionellales bacterium]|nr:proton-conducting transporter membrane subunit [Legionellales bacterium]